MDTKIRLLHVFQDFGVAAAETEREAWGGGGGGVKERNVPLRFELGIAGMRVRCPELPDKRGRSAELKSPSPHLTLTCLFTSIIVSVL